MTSSCKRCSQPIDGPAYRHGRVNRCLQCARICRRCDNNFVAHPYIVCKSCWPRCEVCSGELPTKGRVTSRRRCDECMQICRRCGGIRDIIGKWLCSKCSGICAICGSPAMGTGRRCSRCAYQRSHEMDKAAKRILGDQCTRCGIAHPIQWDHINDDATNIPGKKRTSTRLSEQFEIRKIALSGTSSRLQLLCPNCNWLKAYDRAAYNQPPQYGPK